MEQADLIIIPDDNRLINIPVPLHSKTKVVNNSIDPPKVTKEYPINKFKEKINIIYYGALSKDRGINLLLQLSALDNVSIWIAGKGELEEEILQYAKKCDNIHFLGFLEFNQILSVVQQVDLIYMVYDPSYQHNQIASPNKLYEALYLGKPCIVTEDTSIDQFVEKNNIGYVVTFDIENLVHTIKNISIDVLKIKGENAKLLYPQYSWDKTKKTLLNIYHSITKDGIL